MKVKDVVNGMRVVLTESLQNEEGFQKGDVVTVGTNTNWNLFGWERIRQDYGEDSGFIVDVYSIKGKRCPCFVSRLAPAVNFQLELFE